MRFGLPCVFTGAVPLPLNHEQRLAITDLLSNYVFSLINAKNVRFTVALNAGLGDRENFLALVIALRQTTFLHVNNKLNCHKLKETG